MTLRVRHKPLEGFGPLRHLMLLLIVLTLQSQAGWVMPPEEVGFLDLASADRAERWMRRGRSWAGRVKGLTPAPPFRLSLLLPERVTVRAGGTVELVMRLENIAPETLAIPWETIRGNG